MEYVFGAFKIAILVTVGFIFIINIPDIIKLAKEHKGMDKKTLVGKIVKWVGVFVGVLGIAFYCGAFLAYVQGVVSQIGALAVVGTICLIAGILLFVVGRKKSK